MFGRFAWVMLLWLAAIGAAPAAEVELAQARPPAGAIPAPTADQGSAGRGAIVFRSKCAVCHGNTKVFARRFQVKEPMVRGVKLEDYLAKHHAPQGLAFKDVLAYLKTL